MFVPYLHIAQRSAAHARFSYAFHFKPISPLSCDSHIFFPFSLSVVRFCSLVHCTKNTPNHSKKNQCERAIDIMKTTKRKQTTNFFSLRLSHGRRVDTWKIYVRNRTRSDGQKASHSTERLLATELASTSALTTNYETFSLKHGEPLKRRTWNSFNKKSCDGWICPIR